jgi:hypothetical protein
LPALPAGPAKLHGLVDQALNVELRLVAQQVPGSGGVDTKILANGVS